MYVCRQHGGPIEIVQALLTGGSDINARDNQVELNNTHVDLHPTVSIALK